MKEMTLKDIQDMSLYIMKHFHNFCVSNNIKYSLGYGTMIGAVRHNGFIPWDDDLDIIMTRPEYDRFIELYQDSEEFRLLTPERNNSLKTYARVCEIKRTMAEVLVPWFKGENGLWIDIFPIDGVNGDDSLRAADNQELIHLNDKLMLARARTTPFSRRKSLLSNAKLLIRRIIHHHYNSNKLLKQIDALMKKYNYETSTFCGNRGFIGCIKKECMEKDIYEDVILHKFEDTEFFILKKYDRNLRNYYGDYLQLPPEEQRVPGHSDVQKFYWR